MTWVFEITDKTRRKIHLSTERWKHIVKEHPDISNKIEHIKETLISPILVKNSKYDTRVRFYYKYYKYRLEYLLVSVKYLNGNGFIITAFYTKKLTR